MSYTINTSYRARWYNTTKRALSNIKYIVIHYTANSGSTATAKSNARYFSTTDRKASAHYIIDETGMIYNCVPLVNAAYAVGDTQKYTNGGAQYKGKCTNSNSVSIEMVSHTNDKGQYYISDTTIDYTVELTRSLMKELDIPASRVLTHYEVTGKLCPATHCYTQEGKARWKEFKARLEEEEVTQTQFNEMMNVYLKSVAAKDGSTWSKDARDWALEKGFIIGDGADNYQWKANVTREQLVTILKRVLGE